MNFTLVLTGAADVALLAFTAWCFERARRRRASLRGRVFVALACATLLGALVTGLYAVATDPTIGAAARLERIVPKAFVLAATLLPATAAAAALVGGRLARSFEELTEAATRIAEGDRGARLPAGDGGEAQRLSRALASMRRELEGRPYAAAFLRDAWHDLKTPVAALRATVEVLEDGALDDPPAARRFVENLRRSTEELDRKLSDLVALARYETAAIDARALTPLAVPIGRAMQRVAPLADATGVTLGPPTGALGVRVRCDEDALVRALGNLVENAVHASPGGTVAMAVDDVRDAVVIDVSNEPSRVPPEIQRALFERGGAVHDASGGGRAGTGLGLAIARAAVEAHGGRVRFVDMGPPRVRVRVELPR